MSVGNNQAGFIAIGSAADPVGSVRVGYLYAHSGSSGSTTHYDHSGNRVDIFGSGDVRIVGSDDEPGSILTHGRSSGSGANVAIAHRGHFRVRDILSHTTSSFGGSNRRPGNILLDGGDSSGDATVEGTLRFSAYTRHHGSPYKLEIKNYRDVLIMGDVLGYSSAGVANNAIIAENIAGDIEIRGAIDLERREDAANNGYMKLAAAGMVTLAALDLDKVRYAYVSGEREPSVIQGELAGFDTANPTGGGTQFDPFVTGENRLRAPVGHRIYYVYRPGELNGDLAGKVWQLRNLADDGNGGLLMTRPPGGTVVLFR